MDIDASFVADGETTKPVEPGECVLDDPTVAAEPLWRSDPAASNLRGDAPLLAGAATAAMIVSLVEMQYLRPTLWPVMLAANRRHGVEYALGEQTIVDICSGQEQVEWDALAIPHAAFRKISRASRPFPCRAGVDRGQGQASSRYAEFFAADIRNPNTRRTYARI